MATYPISSGDGPAEFAASVTPSDAVDLAQPARSLFVGGAGSLNVNMLDGSTVLFTGLSAGQILPVRVKRVLNTSTTATAILALY